jgi:hypothetical protein
VVECVQSQDPAGSQKITLVGDIVQVIPDHKGHWAACLVIVTKVRSWGIIGFTPMPPDGRMVFIRLSWDQFEVTGGKAVFSIMETPNES